MKELFSAQVGFFKPVLDGLSHSGVNVGSLLQRAGLKESHLDHNENYVPVQCMYALFEAISQSHGIANFPEIFSKDITLASLAQWGAMIAQAPDVLGAIRRAEKFDQVILTNQVMRLEINGPQSKFCAGFLDHPQPGMEQTEFLDLALTINSFRLAGGPDWAPLEVHLQSRTERDLGAIIPSGNHTKILMNQPETAVVFPTPMLPESMLGHGAPFDFVERFKTSRNGIRTKIEQVLNSAEGSPTPNVIHVADVLNIAPRTLQRALTQEHESYSGIVEQYRLKKALRFLNNRRLRVKEISEYLGYANSSNFERAFQRWTNSTPGQYRVSLSI